MTRKEVLEATAEIVCKDRDAQYGHPENNFELIAKMWSIWLDAEVTASDVAMMMAMLKIARIKTGKVKEDNYIDLIGYIACMTEIDTPTNTPDKTAKPKFDLWGYKGKYAMHCDTQEKADKFCVFLYSKGRTWSDGTAFYDGKCFEEEKENTCYEFNDGGVSNIDYCKKLGYTILEFDNFDWEE